MKRIFFFTQIFVLLFMGSAIAVTFNSGSTGADGAFNPTADTELQLPANGVFNFTTVNIPAGVTVTFKKNAANTPVYILTTGDVTIAGTVSVNGSSGSSTNIEPGKGGPGGYDGGWGGVTGLSNGAGGKGLGPGGGGGGGTSGCTFHGGAGGFGSAGSTSSGCTVGGSTYGNERLIPLIGGSGGGGSKGVSGSLGVGGGGGGGAILIASSGTITVSGSIRAIGANSLLNLGGWNGGGSGGAIRLITNTIKGSGTISAIGGSEGISGGNGRIRLEAYTNNFTNTTSPVYSYGLPGPVFVANTPALNITAIAGINVPSSPTGSYSIPDIVLPNTTTNPVTVGLSASNIPVGTTVTVSAIPQQGSAANVTATLSGTDTSSTASASINLSTTYASVITVQATFTLQTAMYWDSEKIEKVRVAATMGRGSEVIYITETGREIKMQDLMARSLN